MTALQKTIVNCISGEIVTRDFTADELAEHEAIQAQTKKEATAKAKAEQALTDKRQTILDRLGLTADEFNALLG